MHLILAVVGILVVGFFYIKNKTKDEKDRYNLEERIKTEIDKYITGVGCGSICVGVYKNGKKYFYGKKSKNEQYGGEVDENTIFEIGSLTKIFTAACTQILSDDRLVGYDDDLNKFFGNDISSDIGDINILELLTHTSGFPRAPKILLKLVKNINNPYKDLTDKELFLYLKDPNDIKNRGRFNYSNIGYGLVGNIIAKVENQNYEQAVIKRILEPLNMEKTYIASNNLQTIGGYSSKCKKSEDWEFGILESAGAFKSSTKDMLSFAVAHIEPENRLYRHLKRLKSVQPNKVTAIGWMRATPIDKLFKNKEILWHDGQTGGYASYMCIDDKNDFAIVIATNKSMPINMLGVILAKQVRTQSFGA